MAPAAAVGGGADRKIDRQSGDAPCSAAVVHVGGFLVVRRFERVLLKGREVVTQLSKLGFLANAAQKSPAALAAGDTVRNRYPALSLGNFAWLVRLVLVGARFPGKGKIWGVSPRQTFLLSPPAEEGEEYTKDDYQHGKRNQEP